MKTFLKLGALAVGLLASVPAFAASKPWTIDPSHTSILFSINHLGFSTVHGVFRDFTGELALDTEAPENSSVAFTIDAKSIDTFFAKRDEHIRSADFLEVEKFPTITFKSTKVTKTGDATADVTGDLTMKGVTKPVTLKVKLNKLEPNPMSKIETAGFGAETVIKRTEFGVETYAPFIGDEMSVTISTEASPAS